MKKVSQIYFDSILDRDSEVGKKICEMTAKLAFRDLKKNRETIQIIRENSAHWTRF